MLGGGGGRRGTVLEHDAEEHRWSLFSRLGGFKGMSKSVCPSNWPVAMTLNMQKSGGQSQSLLSVAVHSHSLKLS